MRPQYEYRAFFPYPQEGTDRDYVQAFESLLQLRSRDKMKDTVDTYFVTSQPLFGVYYRDRRDLLIAMCTGTEGTIERWVEDTIDDAPFTRSCKNTVMELLEQYQISASTSELNVNNSVDLRKSLVYRGGVEEGDVDTGVRINVSLVTVPNGEQWLTVNVKHKNHDRLQLFLSSSLDEARVLRCAIDASKGKYLAASYPMFARHIYHRMGGTGETNEWSAHRTEDPGLEQLTAVVAETKLADVPPPQVSFLLCRRSHAGHFSMA
jgi:hypothetical protein